MRTDTSQPSVQGLGAGGVGVVLEVQDSGDCVRTSWKERGTSFPSEVVSPSKIFHIPETFGLFLNF